MAQIGACRRPYPGLGYILHPRVQGRSASAGFISLSGEEPRVAFLAALLGFGLAIAASILIYAYAFDGLVWVIDQVIGQDVGPNGRYILMFVLIFVFIAIGVRVGRFARDWIEAGARKSRASAR